MPSAKTRTAVVDAQGHRLRGDAAASYLRMLAAGMPAGGVDVFSRTMAEQRALYDRWRAGKGPIAARPVATAPHIDGRAMDLQTTRNGVYSPSAAHRWLTAGGDGASKPRTGEKLRAHTYGWRRSVPSERWHFEYDRARDTKRSADLKARLKKLGYKDTKAFQRAAGLTADGIDGPQTWAALLTAKPAPTPPKSDPAPGIDFRVASYNAQLRRFGGGSYAADATFIAGTLRPSILLAQEVEESARDAIRAKGTLAKVYPLGTTALMWDPAKYTHTQRHVCSFGTPYHGMVATDLTARNGARVLVASIHVRPNDAIPGTTAQKLAGKLADIRKALAILAKYPSVIIGGDWSTGEHRALLEKAGYRRVTPWADTYDKAGTQHLDAIWIRGPLLTARTGGTVYPTAASDHHGLVANLTITPAGATPL
ncbi:MAG: hypothetical protein QM804_10380 [Propionicimonas sp.]